MRGRGRARTIALGQYLWRRRRHNRLSIVCSIFANEIYRHRTSYTHTHTSTRLFELYSMACVHLTVFMNIQMDSIHPGNVFVYMRWWCSNRVYFVCMCVLIKRVFHLLHFRESIYVWHVNRIWWYSSSWSEENDIEMMRYIGIGRSVVVIKENDTDSHLIFALLLFTRLLSLTYDTITMCRCVCAQLLLRLHHNHIHTNV